MTFWIDSELDWIESEQKFRIFLHHFSMLFGVKQKHKFNLI